MTPTRTAISSDAGHTPPIGVEVSQLTYAFTLPDPLDRVVFVDYRLIHKGTEAPRPHVRWDVHRHGSGGYADDLAGCDSLLEAGFTMNGDD